MSKENIYVELTAPSGAGAYTDVAAGRIVQVDLNDATVVIDTVTYTRTSPLRTMKVQGDDQPPLPEAAAGDAWKAPAQSSVAPGSSAIAIFSNGGS